ncbi:hypothetical protein FPRO04_13450 [Fusarium proliferatum]|nr:hypothetical protein FPRO04_13450 [Fusarium proliferatum]
MMLYLQSSELLLQPANYTLQESFRKEWTCQRSQFAQGERSPASPIPISLEDLLNLSSPRHADQMPIQKAEIQLVEAAAEAQKAALARQLFYSVAEVKAGRVMPSALLLHPCLNKRSRSSSQGLGSPVLSKQNPSEHRRRANSEVTNFDGSISIHGRAATTERASDLKQMKDERQRKKDQAARELEERRKSPAKRAQTPSIPHPNELSSALAITVEAAEPKPLPDDMPTRRATEPPQRSILIVLPSTVYQPPARPPIPRSMSAPIPDEPGQRSARFARKNSVGRIEEVAPGERRRSREDPMPPPPPPPAPPCVIEIVMNNDLSSGNGQASEASPPAPASHRSHNRGTSIGDSSSISGLIHKATELLRSASRSRKEYVRSPPFEAPYESITMPRQTKSSPPVSFNPDVLRSPVDYRNKHLSTDLNRSEMI